MVQCAPGKVIAVPCAEKGRSPDEQMLISGRKDPVFSFRFAASVNRGGIDAISFAIRAFASIKHQIGREGHERDARCGALMRQDRSEEHTSELQSLMRHSYAVFCVKQKKKKKDTIHSRNIT